MILKTGISYPGQQVVIDTYNGLLNDTSIILGITLIWGYWMAFMEMVPVHFFIFYFQT